MTGQSNSHSSTLSLSQHRDGFLLPILTGKNAICHHLRIPLKTGRCLDEVRDVMRLYEEKIAAVTILSHTNNPIELQYMLER